MISFDLGSVFQFAHVLKTSVSTKTKKILAQIGSVVGDGQTDADNVEWVQHVGFYSRPSNPVPGKEAAQAVSLRIGGRDVIIASQDLRGLSLYGQLGPGETCLAAAGEDGTAQARVLLKGDGSINLFSTEGNSSGGSGLGIFVNAGGAGGIDVVTSHGSALRLTDDGQVQLFNGSGGIQIKADGSIKLASGAKVEISGGSVTLGGTAALPLAIGPNVVTAITALQTQLTALASSLTAVAAAASLAPGASGAAAAAVPGVQAVSSGAVQVSAASAIIPAKQTSGQ